MFPLTETDNKGTAQNGVSVTVLECTYNLRHTLLTVSTRLLSVFQSMKLDFICSAPTQHVLRVPVQTNMFGSKHC